MRHFEIFSFGLCIMEKIICGQFPISLPCAFISGIIAANEGGNILPTAVADFALRANAVIGQPTFHTFTKC